MGNQTEILFFAILLIAVITPFPLAIYFTERRAKEMKRVAGELGFLFIGKGDDTFLRPFAALPAFSDVREGRKHEARNVMTKTTGKGVVAVMTYVDAASRIRSLICFNSPGPRLPAFTVRPERAASPEKLAGVERMRLNTYHEFSRRFSVYSHDKRDEIVLKQIITNSGLIAFLEEERDLNIEGVGSTIVVYGEQGKLRPLEIPPFLRKAEHIFSLLTA